MAPSGRQAPGLVRVASANYAEGGTRETPRSPAQEQVENTARFRPAIERWQDEPLRPQGEGLPGPVLPDRYSEIEDKEAYFTEIGEEAERQVSSIYSKLSRPELGREGPGDRTDGRGDDPRADLSPAGEHRRRPIDRGAEGLDDEANSATGSMLEWIQMQREMLSPSD